MRKTITLIAALVLAVGTFAQTLEVESTSTDFTSFSIPDQVSATIDAESYAIQVWMEEGTDLSALKPSFTVSEGAQVFVGDVEQVSGTTVNDFTEDVTYTVVNGDDSQDWVVSVDFWVGIDAQDELVVSVYPNPTAGVVTIEGAENATITVYNILGVVVERTYAYENNKQLNLSSLNRGNYIIRVEKGNQSITKKVTLLK